MTIRTDLLAIGLALCACAPSARAQDLEIPEPFTALPYQDQLLACSEYFGAKARTEAGFNDNVEARKFAVTGYLREMNLALVPHYELTPGPRARAATAIGEAAARSSDGPAKVMDNYCSRAVLAGTRWMSKDARARIEQTVEYDYVHMRPPFRR